MFRQRLAVCAAIDVLKFKISRCEDCSREFGRAEVILLGHTV